jgi:hypothetical protein
MPVTPTLNRARLRDILLAIRKRVSDALPLDVTRVLVVATDDPAEDVEHFGAPRDVILSPGDEEALTAAYDGGGRYVSHRRRHLDVVLRNRVQLDTAQEDRDRLLHESLGHFGWEDAAVDILEEWFVLDAATGDGTVCLTTPLVVKHVGRPRRGKRDPDWVSSKLSLEFEYLRDLTLPEVP